MGACVGLNIFLIYIVANKMNKYIKTAAISDSFMCNGVCGITAHNFCFLRLFHRTSLYVRARVRACVCVCV